MLAFCVLDVFDVVGGDKLGVGLVSEFQAAGDVEIVGVLILFAALQVCISRKTPERKHSHCT